MTKPITNFAASVRSRLLDETRRRKGDFQLTLQRYVAERFLYRLGASPHRERFVLKGAMLFVLVIVPICDLAEYHGFRLNLDVCLGDAVIPFQVDVASATPSCPRPSMSTIRSCSTVKLRACAPIRARP